MDKQKKTDFFFFFPLIEKKKDWSCTKLKIYTMFLSYKNSHKAKIAFGSRKKIHEQSLTNTITFDCAEFSSLCLYYLGFSSKSNAVWIGCGSPMWFNMPSGKSLANLPFPRNKNQLLKLPCSAHITKHSFGKCVLCFLWFCSVVQSTLTALHVNTLVSASASKCHEELVMMSVRIVVALNLGVSL